MNFLKSLIGMQDYNIFSLKSPKECSHNQHCLAVVLCLLYCFNISQLDVLKCSIDYLLFLSLLIDYCYICFLDSWMSEPVICQFILLIHFSCWFIVKMLSCIHLSIYHLSLFTYLSIYPLPTCVYQIFAYNTI